MAFNDCIEYLTAKNAECADIAGNSFAGEDRIFARQEMLTVRNIFNGIKSMNGYVAQSWFEAEIDSAKEDVEYAANLCNGTLHTIESKNLKIYQDAYNHLMK